MTARERFVSFVREREAIREMKGLGVSPPWTSNEIMRSCRFCNVNREHDAVTRWIAENVRPKIKCRDTAVPTLLLCRIFNEPETLKYLDFPIMDTDLAREVFGELRDREIKLMRGAYMMPAHGNGGKGQTMEGYWLRVVDDSLKLVYRDCTHLSQVAEKLMTIKGLGEFLANQVCADLRYQDFVWKDWNTFVLCGPGTRRGLDRWHGVTPTGNLPQQTYIAQLEMVRSKLSTRDFSKEILGYFNDPNNLSNCFCEWDKYERAREQILNNKPVTLRKYGNHIS